jgi:hypothetical protein
MSRAPSENRATPARRNEDAHLRELERQLRAFLDFATAHPLHHFSPGAQKLIVEAVPVVEQLDAIRCVTPSKK